MRRRLITFWLAGVLVGCLPILFTVAHESTRRKSDLSLASVLGGGALLLVGVAIGATTLATLFARSDRVVVIIVGVLALVTIILAAFGYADAATTGADKSRVAVESLVYFAVIVLLGTLCAALAQEQNG